MFVGYALFSFRADPDPLACRGIERKCCPAFDLEWLPGDLAAAGEVFVGKQVFEVLPRVWCWMLS